MEDARRARNRRLARYALALALHVAIAPFLIHDWDGFVFQQSADDFLAGESPYEVAEAEPPHVFLEDHWPPVNSWYAYPPLPLLLFAPAYGAAKAVTSDPAMLRAALKVPFVLGNLGLAFVAGLLVRHVADGTPAAREAKRALVERWLLFNPFLIFIAAAWGMFDAAMMACLLAAVLLVERGRPVAGGVAFAAAALMKIFPLFASPLFAYYVWKRRGLHESGRMVGAAVAAYTAVCLPFFLTSPAGFLNQWLLMHGARSPQGFALVSAPLQTRYLNQAFGWTLPVASEAAVVAASTALLLVVIALVHAGATRLRGPVSLLNAFLALFVGTLLVNKVVNEQYLVMPVALLAVLAAASAAPAARRHLLAFRAFTWGGLVSSILLGFHFITFLPADVAQRTISLRPNDVVHGIAAALDVPVFVVFSVPHLVATLALVPALVWAVRIVGPALVRGAVDARREVARALGRVLSLTASRRVAAALVPLLIVVPPVASAVLAAPEPHPDAPDLPEGTWVAFRYDLAIRNPSYALDVRDGYWLDPEMPTPDAGYYSTNAGKVRDDFARIRELGADVVVLPYDAGNTLRLTTALDAAESSGLHAAPSVDVAALAHCPDAQYLRLRDVPPFGPLPESARADALLARCAAEALREFRDHPSALRVAERPVLFVINATTAAGDADRIGRILREAAPDAFIVAGYDVATAAPAWADAAYAEPPQSGGADALDAWEAAVAADAASAFHIAAAFPATRGVPVETGGESTLARSWNAATARSPAMVLLPWNLYREGSHVEAASDGGWVDDADALLGELRGA